MADDEVTSEVSSEVTDVLGEPWLARTIPLRPDRVTARTGVQPVATLVRRDEPPRRRAVLYVHGFVDYFFHPHVAAALAEHGYDLYALDLRDYGRSIRPGRPPDDVTDLGLYSEEIDTAVRLLRPRYERLVLLGHSTGGLIAALWADARKGLGLIDGLVLNSPWLDLRGSWAQRHVLTPVLDVVEHRPCTPPRAASGTTTWPGRARTSRSPPASSAPCGAGTPGWRAGCTSTCRCWCCAPTAAVRTKAGTRSC